MSMNKYQPSRRTFLMMTVATTAMIVAGPAFSAKQNLLDGVAIQGYDPVAYFTQNAAVEGNVANAADFDGAKYYFANAENRETFLADPAKYVPQYGGFCAYAVSKGATAPIDPLAFTIVEDKLYLNFSKSVRSTWSEDIPGNIERANKNWPALSGE